MMATSNQKIKTRINQLISQDDDSGKQFNKYADAALKDIKAHLNDFISRYADANGYTLNDAKQRVTNFDLQDFMTALGQLSQEDLKRPEIKDRVDYAKATASINQGYMLNALITLSVVNMTVKQQNNVKNRVKQDVKDEKTFLKREYGLKRPPNIKIDTSDWSDKLWSNSDQLANEVQMLVRKNIQGNLKPEDVNKLVGYMNSDLADTKTVAGRLQVAKSNSERLLRTESAKAINDYDLQMFSSNNIKQVKFVVEPGACEKCRNLAGTYPIDSVPRITQDTHPNCRCHIVPVTETKSAFKLGLLSGLASGLLSSETKTTDDNPSDTDKPVQRTETGETTGNLLPRFDQATVPEEKLTKYALDPTNVHGGADKARVFAAALGYNLTNYKDLLAKVYSGLTKYEAVEKVTDKYGTRYQIDMPISGPNGKTKEVRTGWIVKGNQKPRLTSIYVKERGNNGH